jgi:IMP dehydrogenase/GMP reductase
MRSAKGMLGSKTIAEAQQKADFHMYTSGGAKESHPHGIDRIKAAPNYAS